jgi:hypothetical protein
MPRRLALALALLVLSLALGACPQRAATPAPSPEPAAPASAPTVTAAPALTGVVTGAGPSDERAAPTAVTVVRAGTRQPLGAGVALTAGDEVATASAARARFGLGGARFELLPASRLLVEGPGRLRLLAGAVELEAPGAAGPRLRLGDAEVSPRGARFRAAVDQPPAPQPARVLLRIARGAVDVTAGRDRLTLRAGEQVELAAGQPPRRGFAAIADLPRPLGPPEQWLADPAAPVTVAAPPRGFGALDGREPRSGARSRAISLAQAKVTISIRDGFARTEVDERFHNASGERLEGTYRFPIPRGAVLARLQLEVDGVLRDAAVLERQRARRIFETVVDEMLDPALAEWSGQSQVKLRIFPIEPHRERRVVLTYVQPLRLEGDRFRYVFPMAASRAQAATIGRFALAAEVVHPGGIEDLATPLFDGAPELTPTGGRVRVAARAFVPAADFVLEFRPRTPAPGVRFASAVAPGAGGKPGQGFLFAALHPRLPEAPRPARLDYVIVVDTSHSMAPEHLATARESAAALIASLDAQDRFALLACDSFCAAYGEPVLGPADEARQRGALAFLRQRTPGGASDLEHAFREAARLLQSPGGRIVYIGDGAASAGELDRARLVQRLGAVLEPARARVLALGVGGDVDELTLDALARRTGGRTRYLSTGDEAERAAWELVAAELRPTLEKAELLLTTPGVTSVYPAALPAIVAGDDLFVVGRFAEAGVRGDIVLRGEVGGKPFEQRVPITLGGDRGGSEALGRLWAKERIGALLAEDDGAEGPRRREVIALSTRYGLVTPYTSMLVLENAEMEARFGVHSRRRLAGAGEQIALKDGDEAPAAEAAAPADKSAPLGSTAGYGGGGRAAGPGLAAAAPPMAAPAAPAPARVAPRAEERAPAPAAKAKAAPAKAGKRDRAGDFGLDEIATAHPSLGRHRGWQPQPPPPPPPSATVRPPTAVRPERVAALAADVRQKPLARALRRQLLDGLTALGQLDEARAAAWEWLQADREHEAAVLAYATALARLGAGRDGLRAYASLADLAPRSAATHRKLAAMFEAKGERAAACAHRRSVVSLAPHDGAAALDLARCLVADGDWDGARAAAETATRGPERAAARALIDDIAVRRPPAAPATPPRGDVVIEARWPGDEDLDVALVLPSGERLAAGAPLGPGRRVVSAPVSPAGLAEWVALGWARAGRYTVEVGRYGAPLAKGPVHGEVQVKALGTRRTFAFEVPPGGIARVCEITVSRPAAARMAPWGYR